MTRLHNDPARFMDDMVAGFVDANASYVMAVPGGVVRADQTRPGKVAVVVGGGSGHYPAFAGVVGPGFADGAVVGNVFTSPSADDAYNVGRAASNGGGVIITAGNYAGDVINFTAAADRLTREGIPARVLFVTDDIASAPADERHRRRGIAGDFVVFKAMSAAAEEGCDLEHVVRVGNHANDRTRTLGVAFSGCTMPGARTPLFTVPEGKMGVGLGIHGEPGISEADLPTARGLAEVLVDGVLAELPLEETRRVGAILNGLGSTKYEELFIVWGAVARLLADRGLTVVQPEVGELVTSLDMAGCSLTLTSLDDELERLWRAPCDTPAYRKGAVAGSGGQPRRVLVTELDDDRDVAPSSTASRAYAARVLVALTAMQAALASAEAHLGQLDAVAGDGDHGRGMVKGSSAAVDAARKAMRQPVGVATVLAAAGGAWASKAGGTSGALWGAALTAVGRHLGDDASAITPADVSAAMRAGMTAISSLGKASLGDKTMLDALSPFVEALDAQIASGTELLPAWQHAARAAEHAARETALLRPRVGRARPLADRSVGSPDAGAVSLALSLAAVGDALGSP